MKKEFYPAVCFILCSCAPTQFLKKQYEPSKLDGKSIVIYPLFANQVSVLNMDDFKDDFDDVKSAPGEFFKEEIGNLSTKYFDSEFKAVKVENNVDSSLEPLAAANSEKISEKIGNDNFEIRIPKAEYLAAHHLNPKFVMVMDQIVFSRNLSTYQQTAPTASQPATVNVGGQTMNTVNSQPMTFTSTKKSISIGINYAIYDYEEKSVVGYGFAKGEKSFHFAMTKSDWYDAMDEAFSNIKKFSPF